jgi:hypothetical protein
LRAHHAQVAARLATEELSWATLAEALSLEGLRGRNGVDLTGRAIAQVWRRVCRDVEAEADARAKAGPKKKFPSRISPNWRPQVVTPLVASPASPSPTAPSLGTSARDARASSGKGGEQAMSQHAQEQYARMDEQLAKLDRKFRF